VDRALPVALPEQQAGGEETIERHIELRFKLARHRG
jgi:hypothetical protein